MASIDQFPVAIVVEFFSGLICRARMRDGSFAGYHEANLSIEEVRLVWAAVKHLDFYYDWGIGVEQTKFKLRECRDYLEEKKHVAKRELMLRLNGREIRIMADILLHLDHLMIALEDSAKKSRKKARK